MGQILPSCDPCLEELYSSGHFALPHLPLDRDTERVKLGDEVDLEYYRLQRVYSGEITLGQGEPEKVKSPTDVGTSKAKDEKVPLSEIIQILNERFATSFTEEDRLFFEQIREKASKNPQVIQTALANPLDKFQLGIRKLIEEFMVQRMGESDKIVTRYMEDPEFQNAVFPILAKAIFETVRGKGIE